MEAAHFKDCMNHVNKNLKTFTVSNEHCKDLMDGVDSNRKDAFQYLLKTSVKNFKEILKNIMHPVRQYFEWNYDDDLDLDDGVEEILCIKLITFYL